MYRIKICLSTLFLVCLSAMVACQNGDDTTITPEITIAAISSQPMTIDLVDLANDPGTYEVKHLKVTGQFTQLPLLICEADLLPSPASWALESNSTRVLAAGFNSQLRSLISQGEMLTVTGFWQNWQGPVGCGKRATQQNIWYLEVDDIISPVSLVKQFPGGINDFPIESRATPTSLSDGFGVPTEIALVTPMTTIPSIEMTLTSSAPGLATPSPVETTLTPALPFPGTATPNQFGTPTLASTITITPTSGTPVPTATLQPVTTATSPTIVEQDKLTPEELVTGFLNENEIHSWIFNIDASDTITVAAAASPSIDISLSILDEFDNVLKEQNLASAGEIEVITNLPLSSVGDFQVHVQTSGGSGYYALLLLSGESYNFVSKSILTYGESQAVFMQPESDHFWFFEGTLNDTVTITVIPQDASDLFLEFYGADATSISGFIDEGAGGEQEQLLEFVLPDTGMFSIRVGEYDFGQSSYQIVLTVN